ncbi:MAG: hypothetical protein K2Q14_02645 [Gammaproteobacteria bacterium]|nr:hypothetical protein [Gammaproteobacteria bacterium]
MSIKISIKFIINHTGEYIMTKNNEDNPFFDDTDTTPSTDTKPNNDNQNIIDHDGPVDSLVKRFWAKFDAINKINYSDEDDRNQWINDFKSNYSPEIDIKGNFRIRRTSSAPLDETISERALLTFEQIMGKGGYKRVIQALDGANIVIYTPTENGLKKLLSDEFLLNSERKSKIHEENALTEKLIEALNTQVEEINKELQLNNKQPEKANELVKDEVHIISKEDIALEPTFKESQQKNNSNHHRQQPTVTAIKTPTPQEIFLSKFKANAKTHFAKNPKMAETCIISFNKNYLLALDNKQYLVIQENSKDMPNERLQLNMIQYLLPNIVGKSNFIFSTKNINRVKVGVYTLTEEGMEILLSNQNPSIAPVNSNNNKSIPISNVEKTESIKIIPRNNNNNNSLPNANNSNRIFSKQKINVNKNNAEITVEIFLKAYKENYERTRFKSPFSKAWHLENDVTMEEIEAYAEKKPYSRTGLVLDRLKNGKIIKAFVKAFIKDYTTGTLFVGLSSQQWHAENNWLFRDIEKYAADHPESRTATVLAKVKEELQRDVHSHNDNTVCDF